MYVMAPMRATLEDLAQRIADSTIEGLVTNVGPIRSRFLDIRAELPEEVSAALHPVAFMEYRFPDFRQAQRNLERRAEQRRIASAADALVARSEEEAAKAVTPPPRMAVKQISSAISPEMLLR